MALKALMFGSIGTLCDTSGLQLDAFNQAFRQAGLDWSWDEERYRELLLVPGGEARIQRFADAREEDVGGADGVRAIYADKSRLFRQWLAEGKGRLRPGVARMLADCHAADVRVALVSTTDRSVIDEMINGAGNDVVPTDFDLIVDRSQVTSVKPAKEAWQFALGQLDVEPSDCVAIEDTVACLDSAVAAGIISVATPNAFSQHNEFPNARAVVSDLGDREHPARQLGGRQIVEDGLVTLTRLGELDQPHPA